MKGAVDWKVKKLWSKLESESRCLDADRSLGIPETSDAPSKEEVALMISMLDLKRISQENIAYAHVVRILPLLIVSLWRMHNSAMLEAIP